MTSNLILLTVYSGLSLNLILQTGLGLRDLYADLTSPVHRHFIQWAILLINSIVLWAFFVWVLSPLALGFVEYFLLFPANAMLLYLAELFIPKMLFRSTKKTGIFPSLSAYSGISVASSLITLRTASSFQEAVVLSFGFSTGAILAIFIIRAIYRRLGNERSPRLLRGIPLVLISMGLISLVFTQAAVILLNN
jgi:electron transport complex protein RnfA